MECKSFEFNTLKNYKYADIFAQYNGKWIFCKHKERTTWENPGGHIEVGETPLEAAKRELFEETGAISFEIEPLCDYWISDVIDGVKLEGNGQVYLADVDVLGEIPESEMEKICLLDSLPDELTYPEYSYELFPIALKRGVKLTEQFSVPGAGGILLKKIDEREYMLLQTRCKPNAPNEDGLLEIPAGKIRAFESIFDALRREVKEETGLNIVEILGEDLTSIYKGNSYNVINFMPFSCAQNIEGNYPIMVFVFVCYVEGQLLAFSDESKNNKWITVDEVESMINLNPEAFYPMHIDTLRKYCLNCKN